MFPRLILSMVHSVKIIKTATRTTKLNMNFAIRAPTTFAPNIFVSSRHYSQTAAIEEMCVDFDYVKNATSNNSILIVDVREPDELKEHGKIPSSINIPLGNVAAVLGQVQEKEFQQIYGRPKPTEETEIIFYCMIGKRSGMAQENALKLGYRNVKNYLGSFNDWAAKTK